MGSGFSKMKKQARMLQGQFSQMQENLQKIEEEGSAGGGLVKVLLNGENELKKITINPECVDPTDVEGLQDLILSAFKNAKEKLAKHQETQTPSLGGLNLPF